MTHPTIEPGQLYLGCAIWAYPGWTGDFYPRGTRSGDTLELYARRLTAVEGNTTFYSTPPPSTVERWARLMPADFRFAPKLPKALSHQGDLAPSIGGARDFLARLEPLGERLGLVFVQLPATYGPEQIGDLASFVESWPHERAPLGVELRDPRWFEDPVHPELVRTLEGAGATSVVLDTRPIYAGPDDPQIAAPRRKPKLPVRPVATAPRCMVRFVGHPTLERNVTALELWADQSARWLGEGHDVYFFCHCPREEASPYLARLFHAALAARCTVPPLPWARVEREAEQLELF